jgi:hypothetical protein
MAEEKKNQKVYFIVFTVFVLILLGVLYYFVFYNKEEAQVITEEKTTEESSEQNNETEEIDTSNWQTYESEEYGFSLKYPERYLGDKFYSIWESENKDDMNLLKEWGVNKGQETVFVISIYSKGKKDFVLDYFNFSFTDENKELKNNINANIITGGLSDNGLLVEKNDNIYIIQSSFASNSNLKEYDEFISILDKLIIK